MASDRLCNKQQLWGGGFGGTSAAAKAAVRAPAATTVAVATATADGSGVVTGVGGADVGAKGYDPDGMSRPFSS